MFGKRIADISPGDLAAFVAQQPMEGEELELKESLPAKRGRDPWLEGADHIGDKARNELLEEVIAFANGHGGVLLLGVSETKDRPARADKLVAIERCAELAERLRLQCRDCIDPQIPLLKVHPVCTENSGAGIVIFSVPASRLAPHRHTVTREAYARRADRSEKMTMREIQDLTLLRAQGTASVERAFEVRRENFERQFAAFAPPTCFAFGIRGTALPLFPINLHRVHKNEAAKPRLVSLKARIGDDERTFDMQIPVRNIDWRPVMRGMRGKETYDDLWLAIEVFGDGLIEMDFRIRRDFAAAQQRPVVLYPGWFVGFVGNMLCSIERIRKTADAPEIEYGLELEIDNRAGNLNVSTYGRPDPGDWLGPFPPGQTVFPRYSIGSPEEFGELSSLIERDFWNAAGHDFDTAVVIDYPDALRRQGL